MQEAGLADFVLLRKLRARNKISALELSTRPSDCAASAAVAEPNQACILIKIARKGLLSLVGEAGFEPATNRL